MKKNSALLFVAVFGTVFLSTFCGDGQSKDSKTKDATPSSLTTEIDSAYPRLELTGTRDSIEIMQPSSEREAALSVILDGLGSGTDDGPSLDTPVSQYKTFSRRFSTDSACHDHEHSHSYISIPVMHISATYNPEDPQNQLEKLKEPRAAKRVITKQDNKKKPNDSDAERGSIDSITEQELYAREAAVNAVLAETTGIQDESPKTEKTKPIAIKIVASPIATPKTAAKKPSPTGKATDSTVGAINEIDSQLSDNTKKYHSTQGLSKAEQPNSSSWICFCRCRKKH